MILVVAVLVVMASVPLCGGALGRASRVRVRHPWAVRSGLLGQVLVIEILHSSLPHAVSSALHIGTYVLIGWFLTQNLGIPGFGLAFLGGGLNFAAIAANAGVMPATESALRTAGMFEQTEVFANSGAVDDARLQMLGDVFAVPAGWPLANVFSVGDVVLVVAAAVSLHVLGRSRLATASETWRRRRSVAAADAR